MSALHEERCLNHREREAVACCPSCRDFFCRECVTEHQGRVVCAKCLSALSARAEGLRSKFSLARPALALVSFFFVWVFFLALGRILLMLPDSFHDGTVWSVDDSSAYIESEP